VSNCAIGDSPAHTSEHDSTNSSEKSPMRQLSVSTCCWVLVDSGERDADRVVKRKLGQRSPSLFVMPPRPVFDELNHPAASARCKALTGKRLSIQAWGLKAKLLEANALYDNDALPLREIHPELSFLELGLLHVDGGKKIWRGQRARLRVLEAAGIYLPEDLGKRSQGFPQTMCWTLPPQPGLLIGLRMTSLSACPIPRSAMTVDSRSPSGTDRDTATSATTRRIINCPKPCLDSKMRRDRRGN
jgi:Protein of unknown function (DUF429)